MSETKGSDAAFPELYREWDDSIGGIKYGMNPGLTKREYFAGLAMYSRLNNFGYLNTDSVKIAKMAIEDADALLAELSKE